MASSIAVANFVRFWLLRVMAKTQSCGRRRGVAGSAHRSAERWGHAVPRPESTKIRLRLAG